MGPKAERKRCACLPDLNVRIFALTQSRGVMRVFGSIVPSFVLSMLYSKQDLTFRLTRAPERISDDDTRNVVESFEELAEKSFGCFFVSATLDEDVEHVAILINGSPENVLVSTNGKHNPRPIYHVSPQRGRRRRNSLAEVWPNVQTPLSKCFIGHDNPALCQKFFHRTENGARSENTTRQHG